MFRVSQHSIFINKVDLSQATVFLFGQQVIVETLLDKIFDTL